jgi:hypothetical protein
MTYIRGSILMSWALVLISMRVIVSLSQIVFL